MSSSSLATAAVARARWSKTIIGPSPSSSTRFASSLTALSSAISSGSSRSTRRTRYQQQQQERDQDQEQEQEGARLEQNVFERYSHEYSAIQLRSASTHSFNAASTSVSAAPPTPRSTADSLLALLEAKEFDKADGLLRESIETRQFIKPHLLFAEHAELRLTSLVHVQEQQAQPERQEEVGTDWLDWWALSPPSFQLDGKETPRSSAGSRAYNDTRAYEVEKSHLAAHKRAQRMMHLLLDPPSSAPSFLTSSTSSSSSSSTITATRTATQRHISMLVRFGILTARQGFPRIVAEKLLAQAAAFGTLQESESLWEECCSAASAAAADVDVDGSVGWEPFFASASKLNDPGRVDGIGRSRSSSSSGQYRGAAAAAKVREKIQYRRAQEACIFLRLKRGQMLRLHASFGRIDHLSSIIDSILLQRASSSFFLSSTATSFSSSSSPIVGSTRTSMINKFTYLHLLDSVARANRYTLFQQIYALMQSEGRRLTRIEKPTRSTSLPFFIRSTKLHPSASSSLSSSPSTMTTREDAEQAIDAKDAFTLFRYSNYTSSIEEGEPPSPSQSSFLSSPLSSSSSSVSMPRVNGEAERHEAEEEGEEEEGSSSFNDSRSTSLDASSEHRLRLALVAQDLPAVFTLLRSCIESNSKPSLRTASSTILLARQRGKGIFIDRLMLQMRIGRIGSRRWARGYWATAQMMADLREGGDVAMGRVIDVFAESFWWTGLPEAVRRSLMLLRLEEKRRNGSISSISSDVQLGKAAVHGHRRFDDDEDGAEATATTNYPKVFPSAHTFSIAIQALVPLLLSPSRSSNNDGMRLVEEMYASITQQELLIRRRHREVHLLEHYHHNQDQSTATAAIESSPIDPFTFIPFLQAFTTPPSTLTEEQQQQQPLNPLRILGVLADMGSLGLQCTPHHYAILLGAIARSGAISDLVHILDRLEEVPMARAILPATAGVREMMDDLLSPSPTPSSSSSSSLSPSFFSTPMRTITSTTAGDARAGGGAATSTVAVKRIVDLVAYTSMIAGLASRGEYRAARSIEARMRALGLDDRARNTVGGSEGWWQGEEMAGEQGGGDRKLGEVLRLLKKKESRSID